MNWSPIQPEDFLMKSYMYSIRHHNDLFSKFSGAIFPTTQKKIADIVLYSVIF